MNRNMFFNDLKTIMLRKTTIVSILAILTCAIVNYFVIINEQPNISSMSSFEYFVSIQGGASGLLFIILPLSLTLSTGDIFTKERNSSLISFSLVRVNREKYIKNKVLSLGAINFLFMIFCQVLILICALIIFPVKSSNINQGYVLFAKSLLYSNPIIYSVIIILNAGLMSIFFSFLSIIISLLFKKLYAAIMLPYIVFIGFSELLMSMPSIIGIKGIIFYYFSPLAMTGDYIAKDLSIPSISIYWMILIMLSYRGSIYLFNKKFKNETLFL